MEENMEKVQAEKPSYEQLEREVAGLKSMNNQLIMQLQQMNMGNLFKRLDYLFKVLEVAPKLSTDVLNPEFVTQCAKEIEMHMTPTESAEESDTPETEE